MANSITAKPSHEQLRAAFQAGFDSIDDGDGFYYGFQSFLEKHGFGIRDDIPCTCVDDGAHGHQPECRWVRA